jgi:nitrogen fixation protein FixH
MTAFESSMSPAVDKPRSAHPGSAWRSPWVLAWIGLVVVVLGVNVTMVTLAFVTSPGLVRSDYYDSGRAVEESIVSRREEAAGLTMSIDTPADLTAGVTTTIRFFVVDRAGQPVTADNVTYYAYRPSDAERDFEMPMVEEDTGRYAVTLHFPLAGVWDTLVSMQSGDHEVSLAQRINVARP